jgi:magnesium-protoporphyrin O-methyltransferase
MDSCCKTTYDTTFDLKRARKEMVQYLKTGPKKSTKYLLEPLRERVQVEGSLLDIGSGVGALIWELLGNGINQAYYIEISDAYSEAFKERVVAKSMEKQVNILTGDFTEHHPNLPDVDVVTMDKVICCYQDYRPLVKLSLKKARKLYAYTIPRDLWWVKAVNKVESLIKYFGNYLRTHIHPTAEIEEMVVSQGFRKIYQKTHREWLTVIYSK